LSDLWRCSSADAQLAVRYLLAIGQAHMLQVAQQGRVRDLQPDALHPSSSTGRNAHTLVIMACHACLAVSMLAALPWIALIFDRCMVSSPCSRSDTSSRFFVSRLTSPTP
jgi:hypothetical protein